MTSETLLKRLNNHEDGFTERKPQGAKPSDFRQTLVAFANSVPEGQTAVLFIGVANDGKPIGVENPDSLQKKLRQIAERDCYPPVKYQSQVLPVDGRSVVAVIVEASVDRPHFSGPAFVRKGCESVAASPEMYEELIASRNSKAGKILRNKGAVVTLAAHEVWLGIGKSVWVPSQCECRIEGCDAHVVDLQDLGSGRYLSVPLDKIRINKDHTKRRLKLEVIGE